MICATGLPNRVTRTGLRVFRTRSRTLRQVALNLEIAICSIIATGTMVDDHGQFAELCGKVTLAAISFGNGNGASLSDRR